MLRLNAADPHRLALLQILMFIVSLTGLSVGTVISERELAEQESREGEARLEALVQSIDELVFEFDADGRYKNVWTNDESLLIRPKSELIGQSVIAFFDEESARPFPLALSSACLRGTGQRRKCRISDPLSFRSRAGFWAGSPRFHRQRARPKRSA